MKSILALLLATIATTSASEAKNIQEFKTINLNVPSDYINFRCDRGRCHLKEENKDAGTTILLASKYDGEIDEAHCADDSDNSEDLFGLLLKDLKGEPKGYGYGGINLIVEYDKTEGLDELISSWAHGKKLALTMYLKDYLSLKKLFKDKWASVLEEKILHTWINFKKIDDIKARIAETSSDSITWIAPNTDQGNQLRQEIPSNQKIVVSKETDFLRDAFAEEMCLIQQ
ncbi:hypothetical protein DSO57_1014355 [Entomophthora muscae]|uniref:Uncharacterized protein n=1 Tax=Entomophthora muscae TaxID=34485 RepID=A0ACC2U408_9FUNG|nr:hypothetical protein DSO57_1014355 [Entomophthora muscae]